MAQTVTFDATFAEDIRRGLTAQPKQLPSKYFYNEKGDGLFQQIMALEEYYLTRAEFSIFESHKETLHELFSPDGQPFRLIEFGAGDGTKTKVLLRHLLAQKAPFTYQPIDISSNVLDILQEALRQEMPELNVEPICADYFQALAEMTERDTTRKVVLFLGSNIGNFPNHGEVDFLKHLSESLRPGDRTLIGFDLRKAPERILAAYRDGQGVTEEFNLNLLDRINEELGGDFDRSEFQHYPVYDPLSGECRSYLVSKRAQKVTLDALEMSFTFEAWEPIFMEVSRKFSPREIEELAATTGFKVLQHVQDPEALFEDSVWEKV